MKSFLIVRTLFAAVALAIFAAGVQTTFAVNNDVEGVWRQIDAAKVRARGERKLNPERFQTFSLARIHPGC